MPRPNRTGLTGAVVDSLLKTGRTVSEIAEEYGVTVAYVSKIRRLYGKYRTPKERAMDALPWDDVSPEHKKSSVFKNIRRHLYYVAVGPKVLPEWQKERLRAWYKKLEEWVVVRDPDQGPTFNDKYGGWRYEPREEFDKDLILREDSNTQIRDEDRIFWRIPEIRP